MNTNELNLFNQKLLNSISNPFKYPHPPHRPPFIVGGESLVEWFKRRFRESIGQGPKISFVVGVPGAGKSHFLSHLEYLFYEAKKRIKGIYAIYTARNEKINEKELWTNLYWSSDVLNTLKQLLSESKIKNANIHPETQRNLIKYLQGTLNLSSMDEKSLHEMSRSLSKLLVKEQAGICIAIDNIDEYMRTMEREYQKMYPREEAVNIVANDLFGTIRNAIEGLDQIVILLACTQDVYDQLMKARIDLTYGRRIEAQQKRLQELSINQSIELVNRYLSWWAENEGIKLPIVDNNECFVLDSQHHKISIYPFTVKSIEYFNKVTRAMPGDIVCLCSQCINNMRMEGKISIVEGVAIYYALEEAKNLFPQLVLKDDIIKRDKVHYMKEVMSKRLRILINEKNSTESDPERIIRSIERYSEELGIVKSEIIPVRRYTDDAQFIIPDEHSRIWEYKGKRIFVKYIMAPYPPLGRAQRKTYSRRIDTQDQIEALSYLLDENAKVTHVLFITRWVEPLSATRWFYEPRMDMFRPVIFEWRIDDIYDKIVAAVEDTEWKDLRVDLLNHVEFYHAKLLTTLDHLVTGVIYEKNVEDIMKKDKNAMREF